MPAYEYQALDGGGRRVRGLIDAESEPGARRKLRQQDLAPLAVSRAEPSASQRDGDKTAGLSAFLPAGGLSARDRMLATRQLATLIDAGLPVEETLGLVERQTERSRIRRVLLGVRARVVEGQRLADAMAEFPTSFPAVYRALVAAGESSGHLGAVLARLADHLEAEERVRTRIAGALVYPVILMLVALGVIAMLLLFVVPRIAEQFTGIGLQLPGLTRAMIAISGFLSVSWPYLIIAGLGLFLALAWASRRPDMRRVLDAMMSRLPVLGGFFRQVETAAFARTLAILLGSGAVLPDALRAARRSSTNLAFKDVLSTVIRDVETGRSLSDALQRGGWVPPVLLYLVAAGERSGQLGDMFGRAADQIGQDIDATIAIGVGLIEPGIILSLGLVVVLVVLAILLPILQLNTLAFS